MKRFNQIFPWLVLFLGAVYLVGKGFPPGNPGEMNIREFGKLSIVYQGRVKPYDTLARNSLKIISDRQTYEDESGNERPAIEWLLDVIAFKPEAREHKVFRIENKQVLDLLGLQARSGFRYALSEFDNQNNLQEISKQARLASEKDAGNRSVFDRKILELNRQIQLYHRLASSHEIFDFHQIQNRQQLTQLMQRYQRLREMTLPFAVPPSDGSDKWQPLMFARLRDTVNAALSEAPKPDRAVRYLTAILNAYRAENVEQFNQKVAEYHDWQARNLPKQVAKSNFEAFFHAFAPFYNCSALYLIVFLMVCFGWLGWTKPLNRGAFWLTALTLVVHTGALIARMWLQGRPPVTNLYSSAVFIGWGAVLFALVLEWIYRNSIGTTLASVIGFLGLLVAQNLSGDGDTMEMMQAVLDTNFWLATHVTTVTLGYTATFMAGFLGILFVLRGVFTKSLTKETYRVLGRMIYGIVCFALLLSFTGTVLGGIWADQSWGRFWGWDPKENGALIIVLWNALILHARWAGVARERGMAVLSIFGNVITAWSWFGVNMLGVGLHSYGFMDSAVFWLLLFVFSQLVLIGIGSLPFSVWRSFNGHGSAPKTAPGKA